MVLKGGYMLSVLLYKILNGALIGTGIELKPDLVPSENGYYISIIKNGKHFEGFHIKTSAVMLLCNLLKGRV